MGEMFKERQTRIRPERTLQEAANSEILYEGKTPPLRGTNDEGGTYPPIGGGEGGRYCLLANSRNVEKKKASL